MRASDFKRAWRLAAGALFTLTLLILAACGEDEPQADPVTVQFTTAAQTIAEDGGAKNITLSLSGAATKDGTISLTTAPANANTFATFPGEIVITKGSTSAQFTLTPINNAVIDDAAKVITFTLGTPSSGFKLGAQTTHAVTITDDEGPTTANFAVASGTVAENASAGIQVVISLSSAADVAGSVQVTMTPSDAAVTTTPAAIAGIITVPVAVGANSVSFTVIPVDNDEDGDDFEVEFALTGVTGGVVLGTNLEYTLSVVDNDDVVPTPIADVRAMYSGTGTQDITAPLLIQGIVTSMNPQTNTNNIWVQDETGGIIVRFVGANNNYYKRGDELIINLTGARFNNFSGLVQVENVAKPDAGSPSDKVQVVSENNTLPTPEVVTLTQLKTDNYQGKLVAVENVSFVDADGILTMSGTRAITDGTETVNVRTESGAPFSSSLMPLGSGTVKGLAGINAGVVQIIPVVFAEDVFANSPVGTIDVTESLTDFGSIDNGSESTSQSYTVAGTTLTHAITVTASTGFKVSTNDTDFSASISLPSAGGTVYVKFIPVSGANQDIEGIITHKSLGAAPVSFDVTGTETGNAAGAGTLMIYEVYGGGGNSGATYKNDYVVLYNGTASDIDLSAYSLQYGSATSSGNFGPSNIAPLSGTIVTGKFFLVKLAAGNGGTVDLPEPNFAAIPALALGGSGGKIALVTGSDPASVVAPMSPTVVDFVGFGNANFYEGTGATPAPSNTTSIKRKTFVDTNDNSVDFAAGAIDLSYLND